MTTDTTHFGRVVAVFSTLNARGVDPDTAEMRLFYAWLGTVACALKIRTGEAQAHTILCGVVLDDHALRLTMRELTEAARAVPAPAEVTDDWHTALDALACVAGALCNVLPRRPEAMVSSRGGAA